MILVDSSVWVDYFNGADTPQTQILHNTLGIQPISIGDLILTEVLQGFRQDKDYKIAKQLFDNVTVYEMLGRKMAVKSAQNFRHLRKRGTTVRKTADVIIATFCIERKLPLLFSDKDFQPFVKHLGLLEA